MSLRNGFVAVLVFWTLGATATAPAMAQIQPQLAADRPHMSVEEKRARRVAGDRAFAAGDYAEAMRQLMPLAEAGDAGAQNDVATMYQDGLGGDPDYVKAAKWYQLAADQGLATAENTLGVMYEEGQGVAIDRTKALELFKRAAEHGDEYAQTNLGRRYVNGDGVPQDYAQALAWFRRAAEKRSPFADLELGDLYRDGRGVAQDNSLAYVWYSRALRDVPRAYYERDRVWLRQRAEAGRTALAAKLTPEQISKAETEAR